MSEGEQVIVMNSNLSQQPINSVNLTFSKKNIEFFKKCIIFELYIAF